MRTRPVQALAAAWVVIAALAGLAAAEEVPDLRTRTAGDDWPNFLGPTHNNRSAETGIATDWNANPPRILWQRKLGTGYGMPTIARGRLMQFDRVGAEARLTCLSSETGKELWQFKYATEFEDMYGYDDGPRASPVIDGDRLYIVGPEGVIHCLKTADGSLVWKVDTVAKFNILKNFFGVGSTPVIEGDLLIAQVGGSPPGEDSIKSGLVKGNGCGIVAFNKTTGEVVYKITDELSSYSSPVVADIGDKRWCFTFCRGGLVGFDPKNGKVGFQFPWRAKIVESVNASTPVVSGDTLFVSETYGPGSSLLRVKPGGYDVVWQDTDGVRNKAMQCHWMTPILLDGYLYGCSGRHSGNAELRCVELATGKVMWSKPGLTRSSLLYADGHLICLTEYGQVLVLKATLEKFESVGVWVPQDEAGEHLLEYPAWGAPILSHGLLYIRGKDRLLCVELIKPAK
jgi:outer membrane protein assembly factor BamB